MAVISGISIIRSLATFHLTVAYFLLTSPSTITDQNLVFILGAAMDLPAPRSFSLSSPPTAFLALVLVLLSFSDLTASSLPEEISSYYWSSQAPVRLMFFFIVTGYSYAFKIGGKLGAIGRSWGGDELKNSVVFTWGFLMMVCWFWIYVTLRDERRESVAKMMERRKAEADRL